MRALALAAALVALSLAGAAGIVALTPPAVGAAQGTTGPSGTTGPTSTPGPSGPGAEGPSGCRPPTCNPCANTPVRTGTERADTQFGTDCPDVLIGRGGDDKQFGQGGADRLDGGSGNDQQSGVGGNDDVLGGDGDDLLSGGTGRDTLEGGAGNDRFESVDGVTDAALSCGPGADGGSIDLADPVPATDCERYVRQPVDVAPLATLRRARRVPGGVSVQVRCVRRGGCSGRLTVTTARGRKASRALAFDQRRGTRRTYELAERSLPPGARIRARGEHSDGRLLEASLTVSH
jgi:hypothetical protein